MFIFALNKNIIIMENIREQAKPKNPKYFEMRLDGFKETLDLLHSVRERLENIELSLTGTQGKDNEVAEKMNNNEPMAKSSIILELDEVNDRLNKVIYNIQDSLKHLEQIV